MWAETIDRYSLLSDSRHQLCHQLHLPGAQEQAGGGKDRGVCSLRMPRLFWIEALEFRIDALNAYQDSRVSAGILSRISFWAPLCVRYKKLIQTCLWTECWNCMWIPGTGNLFWCHITVKLLWWHFLIRYLYRISAESFIGFVYQDVYNRCYQLL